MASTSSHASSASTPSTVATPGRSAAKACAVSSLRLQTVERVAAFDLLIEPATTPAIIPVPTIPNLNP